MAEQQSWQVTPQQHARIQHILELLPSTSSLPPQHFVSSTGWIGLNDRIMKEMVAGIGEEVKKLKVGMDGELEAVAVEVGGIVNLELCLSLAQAVAFLRMPACSHKTGLRLDRLPDVSLKGCGQAMDVFFAALAQLPPSSTHLFWLILSSHPVYGTEGVCGHLAQLLTSSTAGWLKRLSLFKTSMRAQGMRHIADALQSNTTLKELVVEDCPEVGDAGVDHLSTMLLKNATLEKLKLENIEMMGQAIPHLCHALSSPAAALKTLVLDSIATAADSAGHLGDMLAHNSSLEILCMLDCELEDREGRIGQGLRNNRTLKELELGLEDGSDLKQLFSSVASNTSLTRLTLHTTVGLAFRTTAGRFRLTDRKFAIMMGLARKREIAMEIPLAARKFPIALAMGDMLAQNRSLQELHYFSHESYDLTTDEESEDSHSHGQVKWGHIVQGLRNNSTLLKLDIQAHLLGWRGPKHLFIALATHNTSLRTLRITSIRSGGVPELGRMLSRNCSLQELGLIEAGYSAKDWARVILPALGKNQGLKTIACLGCRGIDGDAVFRAFINLLRINTVLENIDLRGTGLDLAGRAEVVYEELERNKKFRATVWAVPSAKPIIVQFGKAYAGKTETTILPRPWVHESRLGLPIRHLLGTPKSSECVTELSVCPRPADDKQPASQNVLEPVKDEAKFRPDIVKLGFHDFEDAFDSTRILCLMKKSFRVAGEVDVYFFHAEGMTSLLGVSLAHSVVVVGENSDVVHVNELSEEEWKQVWMESDMESSSPILLELTGHASAVPELQLDIEEEALKACGLEIEDTAVRVLGCTTHERGRRASKDRSLLQRLTRCWLTSQSHHDKKIIGLANTCEPGSNTATSHDVSSGTRNSQNKSADKTTSGAQHSDLFRDDNVSNCDGVDIGSAQRDQAPEEAVHRHLTVIVCLKPQENVIFDGDNHVVDENSLREWNMKTIMTLEFFHCADDNNIGGNVKSMQAALTVEYALESMREDAREKDFFGWCHDDLRSSFKCLDDDATYLVDHGVHSTQVDSSATWTTSTQKAKGCTKGTDYSFQLGLAIPHDIVRVTAGGVRRTEANTSAMVSQQYTSPSSVSLLQGNAFQIRNVCSNHKLAYVASLSQHIGEEELWDRGGRERAVCAGMLSSISTAVWGRWLFVNTEESYSYELRVERKFYKFTRVVSQQRQGKKTLKSKASQPIPPCSIRKDEVWQRLTKKFRINHGFSHLNYAADTYRWVMVLGGSPVANVLNSAD